MSVDRLSETLTDESVGDDERRVTPSRRPPGPPPPNRANREWRLSPRQHDLPRGRSGSIVAANHGAGGGTHPTDAQHAIVDLAARGS